MVNDRGTITEFTIGNVAVDIDGRWCTPPVDCGLLGGVFRKEMLEAGVLVERPIRVEDVVGARRVAFLNSVRGWLPAELIDGPAASRS
jgi:para-aminobenzoate synthetase/4-amino-4-deoxychorismate lyase